MGIESGIFFDFEFKVQWLVTTSKQGGLALSR